MNLLSTLLFKTGLSTIPHNLPLQIDNTNLYQPTFNMTMCTRISFWGKMIISSFTPKVMVGWNISWESSVPLQPISLFLRVNKEGLCDGT